LALRKYASDSFVYCRISSKEPLSIKLERVATTPLEEVNSLRMASKASWTIWGVISTGASLAAGCAEKMIVEVAVIVAID